MVKDDPRHDLNLVWEQTKDPFCSFTNNCKSFVQEIIQRLTILVALLKLNCFRF